MRLGVCSLGMVLLSSMAHAGGANYVPDFSAESGTITLTNIGNEDGGRSIATVNCAPVSDLTCPDPTAEQLQDYVVLNNKVGWVFMPAPAGHELHHEIAFFDDLMFQPGRYKFTVCVDDTNEVDESDESDNCADFVKIVE